jgi:ubiquinone/menaquinone biosynthesis C-methylase UbiE
VSEEKRRTHAELQRVYFDKLAAGFTQPIPADVETRTAKIVEAAGLNANSCVLDVATGTGVLIAHFLRAGVRSENITGCDLSSSMLKQANLLHPGVRFWQGDFFDFPPDQGQFDAIFFNACFGNFYDVEMAVKQAVLLLAAHGKIIISHPLGARFVAQLHAVEPELVPHLLPDRAQLLQWSSRYNLELDTFVDEQDLYIAVICCL